MLLFFYAHHFHPSLSPIIFLPIHLTFIYSSGYQHSQVSFNTYFSFFRFPFFFVSTRFLLPPLAHLLASLGELLASLGHLLASLGELLASLGHLLATLGELLASLGHLLASLGELLATFFDSFFIFL